MNTLLCIHSYPAAKERVFRHWPYYLIPKWPIIGIDCEDGEHEWPHGTPHIGIAKNRNLDGTENLCVKLVQTFQLALETSFQTICVIEHDSVFLKEPQKHPGGLVTLLAGGYTGTGEKPKWANCKTCRFFHTPWWADRDTAQVIVECGNRLLGQGEWENGSPDVFISRIIDETGLKWTQANTWSCNSLNELNKPGCSTAIRGGAWYVHGIKTPEDLEWVLSQRP